MNDHTDDNLENELRDVLAHQAKSVENAFDSAPRAIDLADPVPMRRRRRSRAVLGGATGVIAAAAAVTLVVMTVGARPVSQSPSEELAATVAQMSDAGNFDVSYDISVTEPTATSTSAPHECDAISVPVDENMDDYEPRSGDPVTPESFSACYWSPPGLAQHIAGTATVHLDPYAIESDATGESFPDVTMLADSSSVWLEVAGAEPTQSSLPDFASGTGLSTLGPREGPVAMMALASPTGYLTLTQEQTKGATALNETEIDGVRVSEYEVVIPADQMDDVAGTSPAQAETIQWAVETLIDEGYTGTTMRIAVGDDGYIYWVLSTANFADGATVVIDAQFSNFGCAAPVVLPGGQAAGDADACNQTTETSSPEPSTPETSTPETSTPETSTPGTSTTETTIDPANPVSWRTDHTLLHAADFAIEVGGKTFTARDVAVDVHGDQADEAHETLALTWYEQDLEMRLYIDFESDGVDWWANEIRTDDARADAAWVTFTGEFFRSPRGSAWTGSFDQVAVSDGVESHLRLDDVVIQAFIDPATDDTAATMP